VSEKPAGAAAAASSAALATLAPDGPRPDTWPRTGPDRGGRGWTWLWWPTVLGSAASEVVAIAGSLPDSPFKLTAAGSWYFGETPASLAARGSGIIAASFVGFAGLIAMVRIWLYLVRALRDQPGAPLWRVAILLACWCAPMLVVAPLFSRDLYSYAAQGELVTRHIDPYLHGPAVLGSRYDAFVDGRWLKTATPYGPLFVMLAGLMTRIAGPDVLTSLILLRLTALAGVVLLAIFVPVIARRLGYDPALAFAVGVASPLVTFTLIAGGHNDALMAGLLAAGVACALAGRCLLAIVIIACAAAVKAPAVLAIVPLAWTWRGPGTSGRVRAVALAGGLALAGAVLAAFSLASGFGFGWVRNLAGNGQVSSWAAPATWLGSGLARASHWLGLPGTSAAWQAGARIACAGALVLICGYLLLRSGRLGFACALGLMLVALAILSPVVQPWYLIWGLALLACVPAAPARRICLVLAAVAPFMGLPGGWLLLHAIRAADPLLVGGLAAALAIFALIPLGAGATAKLRSGWAALLHFSFRPAGR
jgi:alpha-1,6-mannosyltransferase